MSYRPTDRAIKFMRTYGDFIRTNGDPLPELVETQREIAFFLKAALQPEVLVKSYPRRRKFKRRGKVPIDDFSTNFKAQNAQMVANFKADPGHFLHPLIERINEAERRAQWIAEESPPATAWNLSIRDKRWSLKRNPYGGPGTVLHWLARVLEQNRAFKTRVLPCLPAVFCFGAPLASLLRREVPHQIQQLHFSVQKS